MIVNVVNRLLDSPNYRLFYAEQLREAAGSITSNIREAYGRRQGRERNQFFRYACGSAEETDERLRGNFRARRVPAAPFWRIHNRVAVVVKMLNVLMGE